ncbi:MAG: EAL domain-containing protein [Pseudomonadota bacterium]
MAITMFDFLPLVVAAPDSSLLYAGHYNPLLVVLSVVVAMFASYAALLVSQHVIGSAQHRRAWLSAGGVCLGLGIWAMHFVGMLAFTLPCASSYDYRLTFISTVPAVLACTMALHVISLRAITPARLAVAAVLLGAGIGAMHYTGMAAMNLDGLIRYDLKLFLLSILVAVLLAALALWMKFRLGAWPALSAAVMGSAVAGMHYTAMAAAYFVRSGENGLVDSQISPAMLSGVVLAATSAIIIGTMLSTYVGKYKLFSFEHSYRLIALLICGWIALAAVGVDYIQRRMADDIVSRETRLARRQADDIAANIAGSLQVFKGIPQVLAQQDTTREALLRQPAASAGFAALNRSLALAAAGFKADAIIVVDATGNCIAASNAGQPGSFIGINYADRDYFAQARAGLPGSQFAVGRASKIGGLYYSYPLFEQHRFLGAVVVKRNLSAATAWIGPSGAFLADSNGVIVFSMDKRFEFRSLPSATVAKLDTKQRLLQYARTSFVPLAITPWGDQGVAGAVQLELLDTPVVLGSTGLAGDAIRVHVPRPLTSLVRLQEQRWWLFALISAMGATLIVAAAAIVLYLRETRRVEADLRVAATAFETQEGMLITDSRQLVLRTNRAFSDITGFGAREVAGRHWPMFDPARHDEAFCADVWQAVEAAGSWQGEVWNCRKSGASFPQSLVITAVRNGAGVVSHYVCALTDITARKAAEEEIRNLALYDFLTGLPNRRCLMERLQHALAVSMRSGLRGALLFIDLDNFKVLNDTLGHNMGDMLLQQVAVRFRAAVRDSDTVARLGGDEFVVMLEGLDRDPRKAAEYACVVGQKIQDQLRKPYALAEHEHNCTASIGVTLFHGAGENVESLLKQTDLAMYQSKAAGRNTLHFFAPAMQAVASARATLDNDLRSALALCQFSLHYQPQIDASARLVGAEALLRWEHPQRGMVAPAEFIGAAEESGLILALGDWVLTTACAQLVAWAALPATNALKLSINVSPRQFRQPGFVARVLAVLDASGADPHLLKLELTESLLLDDVAQTIAKMEALKLRGVGISLDDFGTGYSSLTYLKRLPLCELKIDRSFVRDIVTSADDAAIIRTILTLAHNMGIAAIAEGVETVAQRDFLASMGCTTFQGFLFSQPLPGPEFIRYCAPCDTGQAAA